MELTVPNLLSLLNVLGLPGLIVWIWYVDQKKINEILAQNAACLSQYKTDMTEMRKMYESNVVIIKRYNEVTDNYTAMAFKFTETITKLTILIENNMYCPLRTTP